VFYVFPYLCLLFKMCIAYAEFGFLFLFYLWCLEQKGTYIATTLYNKSAVAFLYQHCQHILDKGF